MARSFIGNVPLKGFSNTCRSFNGTDNWVLIGDDADFSISTTGELTISAWFSPDVLTFPDEEGSGYVHWISKVDTDNNEWLLRIYGADNSEGRENRISFYVYSADGLPQGDGVAFQETVTPGQWLHIVANINSSGLMKLYKNAVFKDDFTTSLTLTDTTTPVRIGTGAQNANPANRSYFKGRIYDVCIWNRVLSASEITNLYSNNTVPSSGLVGRWKLDEEVGNVAIDSSGNGNHGTITGTVSTATGFNTGRRSVLRNSSIVQKHNGQFEATPSFTAATGTNGRWINGAAGGSNAVRSAYSWAIQALTGAAVAQFDNNTTYSGNGSLKLSTVGTGQRIDIRLIKSGSGAAAAPFYIKASPSTAYNYSVWIKTDVTSGSSTGAAFLIAELAADATTNPASPVSVTTNVTQDWTQYTGTFTTSSTTEFFTPRLSVIGNAGAGTLIMDAWFDDFEITPVSLGRVTTSNRVAS